MLSLNLSKLKKYMKLNSAKLAFYEQRIVERILPRSSASSTRVLNHHACYCYKVPQKICGFSVRSPIWEILCLCSKIVLAHTRQLRFQFLAVISVWLLKSGLNYPPHFPVRKMGWESTNVCVRLG